MSLLRTSTLAAALTLLATHQAHAFCGATSCNKSDPNQHCTFDAEQCETSGFPLSWASSCVTFNVQKDAAASERIDYDAFNSSVQRAFAVWSNVRCEGGEAPSLDIELTGPVSCDVSEYNPTRSNANIVMFREESWPYAGSEDALGITRLRFDPDNGELWDADIEINAVDGDFSVGTPVTAVDLDSVLTHEAGHALGLSHTTVLGATMRAGYTNDDSMRTLEQDDIDGICAIYPPGRDAATHSCEPRHGFSELCAADQPEAKPEPEPQEPAKANGCHLAAPGAPGSSLPSLLGAGALLAFLARTRRSSARKR
jgi:hypothetical protein